MSKVSYIHSSENVYIVRHIIGGLLYLSRLYIYTEGLQQVHERAVVCSQGARFAKARMVYGLVSGYILNHVIFQATFDDVLLDMHWLRYNCTADADVSLRIWKGRDY